MPLKWSFLIIQSDHVTLQDLVIFYFHLMFISFCTYLWILFNWLPLVSCEGKTQVILLSSNALRSTWYRQGFSGQVLSSGVCKSTLGEGMAGSLPPWRKVVWTQCTLEFLKIRVWMLPSLHERIIATLPNSLKPLLNTSLEVIVMNQLYEEHRWKLIFYTERKTKKRYLIVF